jgi:hypothetical protein
MATQTTVIRAKVALDWLQGIVASHFSGRLSHDEFHAEMRAAWDSIAADGLTSEVSDLWRIQTYGAK